MASLHDRHFRENHQGIFLTTYSDVGTMEVSGELGTTGPCPFTLAWPWSYLYFAREVYWNPRETWPWRPLKDNVHFLALDSLPSWDDQSISCSSGAQPGCYSGQLRVESLAGTFHTVQAGFLSPTGIPVPPQMWGVEHKHTVFCPTKFSAHLHGQARSQFLRATIRMCKCLTFKAL